MKNLNLHSLFLTVAIYGFSLIALTKSIFRKITLAKKPISLGLLLLAMIFGGVNKSWAQPLSITTAGVAVTQNFDALAQSGTTNAQSGGIFASGWSFLEAGSGSPNTTYSGGTGSATAGDTYSFGVAGTNTVGDRAFGMLQSGSLTSILGFQFTNNTGSTITSLTVGYTGEEWRKAAAADNLAFSYQLGNVALNATGFTAVAGLTFTTPVIGTAAVLDGNATANRTVITPVTITGLSIPIGTTVTLRWVDATGSSSAGMAIDDFTITLNAAVAATVPGAPTGISATAGNAQATVSFTAPSDGGSTITSYTATSAPGGIQATVNQAGSGSITVTGLSNGTAYTFTVTATNGVGTSVASVASNSVTPAAATALITESGTLSTAFVTTYGTASAVQSFSVSGANMSAGILVTAPAGYEVSQTSPGTAGFAPTQTVGTSGTIASTTIYVRLQNTAPVGTASGLVTLKSTGATEVDVAATTGTITPKPLSITTPTIASKVYDGTAATGAITLGTLSGFVGTETVTATATGTYPDATAAIGKTATIVYTLANGTNGGLAANYSLANGTATGDITKVTQIVTFAPIANKTTADTSFTLSATASGGGAITYTSSNTAVDTISTITANKSYIVGAAGTSVITATQAGDANHASASATQTLTVLTAIAKWTFETTIPTTAGPFSPEIGSGAANGSHASGAVAYSSPAGSGSSAHSFSSNTWAVGDYYQFKTSAIGYNSLSISFDQMGSGTGPARFKLLYSTDGTTFTAFGSTYLVSATFSNNSFDLSSITALNGAANIYFRLVDTSTVSISGSTVATGGTDRVDNVTIAGTFAPTAPNAPTIGTATAGIAQATVSFTAPASNGGSPITSYTVTSAPGGITATGTASPITVTGLTDGTAYTFTVTATNAIGTSVASAASNSVTPVAVTPVITESGTLSSFSTTYGTSSVSQNFSVSGTNITGGILVTAPANYEVSQTSATAGFAATQTIGTNGTVASTTVYVRLKATAPVAGTTGGNVTITSNGATEVDVAATVGTITPAALSVSGTTIAPKQYDGSATTGAITVGTLSGFIGTETVTATATGTYADANVGTGKTATVVYTLANGINGGLATNYSLANGTATGDITGTSQTINFAVIPTKTFPDTAFALIATASSGLTPITFSSSNPSVATISGNIVTIVGLGTATITASQTGNTNVSSASATQTLKVGSQIAKWTFETSAPTTAGPVSPEVGSGSATGFHAGTTTYSAPGGNGSAKSYNSNGWAVNDYYQFQVNTTNYSGISISYDQVGSGTGPANFVLKYSTDGVTFTNTPGYTLPGNITSWSTTVYDPSTHIFDLSSITALNGQSTVYFRIVDTSTISVSGGTIGTSGTDRVDNFSVIGTTCGYIGGDGGDWSSAGSWSCGVPASNADVTISNGSPVLSADVIVHNLVFNGTTLSLNGHRLTINGTISGSGTLTGSSTSNLTIGGAAGTLNFESGSRVLKNLILNSGATATLGTALDITAGSTPGTVTVASGATLTTGGNLTIKSDANGTASVGTSAGTISGNVTVERYIPNDGSRAWRILSTATNSALTIQNSWQAATQITTSVAGNLTNGFDAVTPYTSMQTYQQSSNSWIDITSTKVPLSGAAAYSIYIRGDRSATPTNTTVTATTLSSTGALYQGNITTTIASGSFGIVGNQYASAIDFTQLSKSNINPDVYYVWDPKLIMGSSLGSYQAINHTSSNNTWYAFPGGASYPSSSTTISPRVESGQAFFVATTASPASVTLTEGSKVSGSNMVFRPQTPAGSAGLLRTNFYDLSSGAAALQAANQVVFSDLYSDAIDNNDIARLGLTAGQESLDILRNGKLLMIEGRQPVVSTDTIFFNAQGLKQHPYKLEFLPSDFGAAALTAYLQDNYLGTKTAVSLSAASTVQFSVDANAASAAANRFEVVFSTSTPVPVRFTGITAVQQGAGVLVSWQSAGENGIAQYVVEHSTDGTTFSKIATAAAKNNNGGAASYSYTDAAASTGTNYYRVYSVGVNGGLNYTQVVSVTAAAQQPSIAVYPNPVSDGHIHIALTNEPKGSYSVRLLNAAGQLVYTATLTHGGGTAAKGLELPAVSQGVYQLEILTPAKETHIEKLTIK